MSEGRGFHAASSFPKSPGNASSLSSSKGSYPFTFRYPGPGRESGGQSSSDTLCRECLQLDLEQSFQNAFDLYESARRGEVSRPFRTCRKGYGPVYVTDIFFVTSLGNRLSRTTSCKLCNFLGRLTTEPSKGAYKLMAFCSSESYLFEPRKKDVRGKFVRRPWEARRFDTVEDHALAQSVEHNVFMALVPEIPGIPKVGVPVRWFETDLPKNGLIFRLTLPESDVNRLVVAGDRKPMANLNLMRAWLGRCRCHHPGCSRRDAGNSSLSGFRVIDCNTMKIIDRPWSKRYVALSYVWGPPPFDDWPQTVVDAVEVTKRLGERFLWVDRTCIDQKNLEVKMELIAKMDAIYQGAEFTIVCAAGDARMGLPGVRATLRKSQPWVELPERSDKVKSKGVAKFTPGSFDGLLGVTEDEYDADRAGADEWMDDIRFGMRGKMAFDFNELLKDINLKKKYDIPDNHLAWYREMAEDDGWDRVEDYLERQLELARRMGIPLKEMVPRMKREIAAKQGWELDPSELDKMPIGKRPLVDSAKPRRTLPPNVTQGKLTLVSTMQEPRLSIRGSEWATRGWTYQEGVLSNRRLVFTEEQVYWECRGMAVSETVDLALDVLHEPSGNRMADYMLSGIFDDDLHQAEELQYGFQPPRKEDVGDHVVTLDGHIQTYTSRKLTDGGDTLKAFMGVAASYTTNDGLYLLLGLPVWAGAFANDRPGLQHTFALSLSSWTHVAERIEDRAEMYIADCPRRSQFPSWSWAGWQGTAQFCNEKESRTHRMENTSGMVGVVTMLPGPRTIGEGGKFDTAAVDPSHSSFFKALTSKEWVNGMGKMWSAETMLHTPEGT